MDITYITDRIKVNPDTGCWEWALAIGDDGYGVASRKGKYYRAHRLSWELTNGPIPDGAFVCHHCDNPPCVNPEHLFLGDAAANAADREAKRRGIIGETHPQAKLTESQVVEILKSDEPQPALAERYGISRGMIGNIKAGLNWKHISVD